MPLHRCARGLRYRWALVKRRAGRACPQTIVSRHALQVARGVLFTSSSMSRPRPTGRAPAPTAPFGLILAVPREGAADRPQAGTQHRAAPGVGTTPPRRRPPDHDRDHRQDRNSPYLALQTLPSDGRPRCERWIEPHHTGGRPGSLLLTSVTSTARSMGRGRRALASVGYCAKTTGTPYCTFRAYLGCTHLTAPPVRPPKLATWVPASGPTSPTALPRSTGGDPRKQQ